MDKNGSFSSRYVMTGIKMPVTASYEEILAEAEKRFCACGDFSGFHISKLSVDARKKSDVRYVASVIADRCGKKPAPSLLKKYAIEKISDPARTHIRPAGKDGVSPVIVGFGPAGMFSALMLAEAGYAPIVIERGDSVDKRALAVDKFYKDKILDPASNIQFGAGGAGTFSDGKLVTRINDGLCSYVLEKLAEFGAPDEIKFLAKPHIGTDRLRNVVKNIAARIEELGGRILYRSKLEKINSVGGEAKAVVLEDGTVIPCGAVILAVGHSARDTYKYLMDNSYAVIPKPFSVGVRIEHLQEDIDSAMFGDFAGRPGVPHAEYTLSHRHGDRGVYTFCMCPGGEVMAATSECGGIVTNGMSRYLRDGRNANAAVAVSVTVADYGNTAEGAIEFQRNIETSAFRRVGGRYSAPAQTVGAFLGRTSVSSASRVTPSYMSGDVEYCGFDGILPEFVLESLRVGLVDFGRKIPGFDRDDAVLTGPETRTSAPVRILRNEEYCAMGTSNIYPAGEGAGYAGGITSAAIDGIKVAAAYAEKFGKK